MLLQSGNVFRELLAISGAKLEIVLPANSAEPRRSLVTSSLTNPSRPGQTSRVLDQVPESRFGLALPAPAIFPRTDVPTTCRTPRGHRSKCRNHRLCQIVPHCANSNQGLGDKDKLPCSEKRVWGRVRVFPAQFSGAGSQAFPLTFEAVLWSADKHFDQIVVQAIIELALQAPFELGVV